MKTLLFVLSFFLCQSLLAQETISTSNNLNTQVLTYHKEIPAADSYSVIKNTSGTSEIPTVILEEINFHRKSDVDYKWVVNDQIEILIHPMNREKGELQIHTHKND